MHADPITAEKLAASLTAETVELLPYLPYLLQDLWVLGTPPQCVERLIRAHIPAPGSRRFLDLGCGKGAVAVKIAQTFRAEAVGVDLMPEFIEAAVAKAEEHGVSDLCRFRVGDVKVAVEVERGYDCVIWGAVGNVLGGPEETLTKLLPTVRPGGYVIIDDAYLAEDGAAARYRPCEFLTRDQWRRIFAGCGAAILEEAVADADEQARDNADDLGRIESRAGELAALYPELKALFEGYVASQNKEIDDLADALVGAVWLLRKQ